MRGIGRNAVTSTVGTYKDGADARSVIKNYPFLLFCVKNTTSTKSLEVLPPISSEKE